MLMPALEDDDEWKVEEVRDEKTGGERLAIRVW